MTAASTPSTSNKNWRVPLKRAARWLETVHLPVRGPTRLFFGALYAAHVATARLAGWTIRAVWLEPLFRSRCGRVGRGLRMEKLPFIVGRGNIELGDRVSLSGKQSVMFSSHGGGGRPELIVGNHVFIGHGAGFSIARSVTIGDHCLLASGVQIQDHDGHPIDADDRRAGLPAPASRVAPVEIGNDVWVGSGAVILKGVRVGDRAIIGARAVVTRNVAADTIVAGNPARVVKEMRGAACDQAGADSSI